MAPGWDAGGHGWQRLNIRSKKLQDWLQLPSLLEAVVVRSAEVVVAGVVVAGVVVRLVASVLTVVVAAVVAPASME